MRRITALLATLTFAMSGLVFSPAQAAVPSDGTYLCTSGAPSSSTPNFKITNGVVSEGGSCVGDVVIPDGVTSIEDGAFGGAKSLNSITIPASVTDVDGHAFRGGGPTSIIVDPANANYTSTSGVLFDKASTTLIAFPSNKDVTSYSIPGTVTIIGDVAFSFANLTSVTIPSGVTSIGWGAFEASDLTSVDIPASVTNIGSFALYGTGSLSSITVDPANANYTSIEGVLFNEASTTLIAYPANRDTTSYSIPSSVTSIESEAFLYARLTSVTIPETVTSIGTYAFEYSKLTSVTIPSGVTSLEYGIFYGANSLTSVTIPASVTSLGDAVFRYTSLTSVYFLGDAPTTGSSNPFEDTPAGARAYIKSGASGFGNPGSIWNGLIVTRIRPGTTFPSDGTYDCNTGLRSTAIPNYTITNGEVLNGANCRGAVVIPEGVTAIGYLAFSNSSITRVIIPSTVASIGLFAFDKATALTSIYVARANETFSSIDGVLFNKDVSELIKYPQGNTQTNYIIPASVSSLEDYAFSKVASLQYIDVMNGDADFSSIGGVLFNYSDASTLVAYPTGRLGNTYSIPTIVTRIENTAFYGTPLLANVTIPNSVTSIGGWAFSDMASLTSITIPASVSSIESNAFEYGPILTEITFLGSIDSGSATDGTIKLPRVGGTKYTLNGWYSDASFQTKVGDGGSDYNVSSAVTLHAKITRNPVKAEALTKPTISGKAISTVKGTNKLTAKKGTWTGFPTPVNRYQWYSCTKQVKSVTATIPTFCKKVSKATKSTLALNKALKGKFIAVAVTGKGTGSTATTWLSKSTAKVK